jgi:hypothetical protein
MRSFINAAGVMVLILLHPAIVSAQSETDINRARTFIEETPRSKGILFFAHPEAQFQSVEFVEKHTVVDGDRKVIPGHFAFTYRYAWKSGLSNQDNTTQLIFFFDQGGRFYSVKAGTTTSFFRPFEISDAVVKELRDQLIQKVDREGSENDKRLIRTLIQNGDARGMLTLILRLAQK